MLGGAFAAALRRVRERQRRVGRGRGGGDGDRSGTAVRARRGHAGRRPDHRRRRDQSARARRDRRAVPRAARRDRHRAGAADLAAARRSRCCASLPLVGAALFGQHALVYLGLCLTPVLAFVLAHTGLGLRLRSLGDHPHAAASLGLPVRRYRVATLAVGGALGGLGGAALTLAATNTFVEGITAGRGFIALAVVVFGRWSPWGALAGSLLFGLASALQFQFQAAALAVPVSAVPDAALSAHAGGAAALGRRRARAARARRSLRARLTVPRASAASPIRVADGRPAGCPVTPRRRSSGGSRRCPWRGTRRRPRRRRTSAPPRTGRARRRRSAP